MWHMIIDRIPGNIINNDTVKKNKITATMEKLRALTTIW
jgi:hypothetical protein